MKKRFKMKPRNSRKIFRRTADRTHKFNIGPRPMRGGIRL